MKRGIWVPELPSENPVLSHGCFQHREFLLSRAPRIKQFVLGSWFITEKIHLWQNQRVCCRVGCTYHRVVPLSGFTIQFLRAAAINREGILPGIASTK